MYLQAGLMIKMEKWEIALQKFLKKWENKKEVIGALVCGSYITGNPSKHSDIDIHIFLDSKTSWRERGNKVVEGILIEYFAYPVKKHYHSTEKDYRLRRLINAHMLCTGKVLFDKTGELKKLIQDSRTCLVKKNPRQNKVQIELAKYHIWDMCDNLEDVCKSDSEDFFFVFYNDLNELFKTYAKFSRFNSIPVYNLRRFLVNEKDKKKYHIDNFPDDKFVKMIVSAINIKDKSKMMKGYQKLTNYVLKKMGGFNIDGWKIKSPAK